MSSKRSETTYQKINTIFKRDEHNIIMPYDKLTQPEFEYLRNLKWHCEEKIDGTNIRIEMTHELLHDDTFEPYSLHFEVKYKGKTDNANVAGDLIETLKRQYPADKVAKAFGYDEYMGIDELEDFGLKIVKDEKEGLKILKTNGNPLPNKIVIYGEGYGAGIQSGGYYRKDKAFIMFDVAVDGKYLTIEQRNEIGIALDADMVPFIADMTIDEAIEFVKKGFDSRIASETHPAEGLVVRPMFTLYGRNGERIITKIKTCDFNDYFRKYGTYDKVEQKTNKFIK